MDIWEQLYEKARAEYHPEEVTPFFYAHNVVCALESASGRIFTGFCVEPPSGGGSGMPCGACREFLMQLSPENRNTEIMVDYAARETVTLGELMPNWWGMYRYGEE